MRRFSLAKLAGPVVPSASSARVTERNALEQCRMRRLRGKLA